MKARWGFALLLIIATQGGLVQVWGADLLPRSESRSHQFVVYAADGAMRNAVGTVGEDVKDGILQALGLHDDWKLPIVVDLRYPEPSLPGARPPNRILLGQTGAGLKVEIDLLLGEAGRGNRIRDELVRAILLEMAYRNYAALPAGGAYNLPPAWLVEGMSGYLENKENGVAASMFAALLPSSQTLSLQEFLNRDPAPLDATSHSVYRAYAFALVQLLVDELPSGKKGLAIYIADLPGMAMDSEKGAGGLRSHFAEFAESPEALDKWWSLSLARLAEADAYQPFSLEESDQKLTAALRFNGPGGPGKNSENKAYSLSDYRQYLPLKKTRELLEPVRRSLMELSARASPLLQPEVAGYQAIVAQLARGKTGGLDEQFARLADEREKAVGRKTSIDDYLNWYEATQLTTVSGAFDSYFRSAKQAGAEHGVQRPDAISAYLDGVEMEFR